METEQKKLLQRITDKLFGGIEMTWLKVLLFAVGTAILTAIFLIVPLFRHTSFEQMGVTYEAWIFFAVIIMSNCKKPLESALKTFVFFLVSQPLIYLFQVPFSWQGWRLFAYYRTWFLLTIATFPAAWIGWYIRKKNWLSLLILAPVLCFLTMVYLSAFRFTFAHFPYRLVTALFCLGQVVLYLCAFTSGVWQKVLGFAVPFAAMLVLLLLQKNVVSTDAFLPDDPVLTESAYVVVEDSGPAAVTIIGTGADSMVRIHSEKYGTTAFVIRDGGREYRYTVEVYEDVAGSIQVEITER